MEKMSILERCIVFERSLSVLERDVHIREICLFRERCLYLREMSVLERGVCIREMSVLK